MPLGYWAERSCANRARNKGCERVVSDDSKRAVWTVGTNGGMVVGMAESDRQ
jgi:hypothetical protein